MAGEFDFTVFMYGVLTGLIPVVFFVIVYRWNLIDDFLKFVWRGHAVRVYLLGENRQMITGIGKFQGKQIVFKKQNYPYKAEHIGLIGKTSFVILYEKGAQVALTTEGFVYPITAKEFDAAVMNAMISAASSIIVKMIKEQRMLIIGCLIAAGAAAFFGYNLVDKLIK